MNRVTQMTDGLGSSGYSYDVLNRVTSVDGPLTNDTLTYSYDALGRRNALGVQGAAANVTYGFDALDRLSQIVSAAGTWGYNYSGNSDLLTQLTRPNGSYSSFSYDSLQRLTGVGSRKADTSLISGYNYGYDNRDIKTFVERQVGTSALQRVNYSYDSVDQLTLERSTEATPIVNNAFAYDTRGNRTASSSTVGSTSYVPNALNQVTSYTNSTGTTNLTHDADGNLTQQAKGNGGSLYTYDEENRLIRVVGVNQTTGVNEHKSEFFYDGQSRKAVSREFTWNSGTGAWVQQSETRRVYDGMDVVQERDGSNAVTANYTRSGNIGGILARSTTAGHFYYHYDGGGNVMQLTDSTQATVAQYSYDGYGVLISAGGVQSGQPYRYSTKEYHDYSGLYDYGYRFYSPNLGRWLNRDPLQEAGGINLYAMVGNDPVNFADEYGLIPEPKDLPSMIPQERAFWDPKGAVPVGLPDWITSKPDGSHGSSVGDLNGDSKTDWLYPVGGRLAGGKVWGIAVLQHGFGDLVVGVANDGNANGALDPGELPGASWGAQCEKTGGYNAMYIAGNRYLLWFNDAYNQGNDVTKFWYDSQTGSLAVSRLSVQWSGPWWDRTRTVSISKEFYPSAGDYPKRRIR